MKAEIYLNGWLVNIVADNFGIEPPLGSEMSVPIMPRKRIRCVPEIWRLKVERVSYEFTGDDPIVTIETSRIGAPAR